MISPPGNSFISTVVWQSGYCDLTLPFFDLRSFLESLKEEKQVRVISKQISPRFELAAYIRKSLDTTRETLLFNNVKGYDHKAVGAIWTQRRRLLKALGTDQRGVYRLWSNAVQHPIKPRVVSDAPCQEVAITGDDVDLLRFPQTVYSEDDAGAFITPGVAIVTDPDLGYNASIHRMQIFDRNTTGCLCLEQHLGQFFRKQESLDRPLDLAICIGADPVTQIASQHKGALGESELDIAGGLLKEPLKTVHCKTIDVDVPASSEIVLEGQLLPNVRRMEGPFGEFCGYYTQAHEQPVFKVSAITHRRDPIYQTLLTGMPPNENTYLKGIPQECILWKLIKTTCSGVKDVYLTDMSGTSYHARVSIKQIRRDEAISAMMSVLGSRVFVKQVTVVDDDVDVFDDDQMEWAVTSRVQAKDDVIIIPRIGAGALDPSRPDLAHMSGSVLLMDGTRPFGQGFSKIVRVPGVDQVNLDS
jgi:2,5-furandicarboxylate decarboxylase 1